MRQYTVTLRLDLADDRTAPDTWFWPDLLDLGNEEAVTVLRADVAVCPECGAKCGGPTLPTEETT